MKRLLLALPLIGLAYAGTELQLTTRTGVLHGTLESPAQIDKTCVVLILAGSGPTDRDGNSLGLPGKNDSLKKIAVDLARRGISSLRCDKRGIGESKAAGPKEENLRFETYIDDVVSWLEFLESKQGFKKVVILGHSEGALIGLVAANKHQVAGYLSLAGTSQRAAVLLREQIATKLPPELLTEANVILQQLDQGFPVKKISNGLDPLFRKSAQPYLISWFHYTPTEELAKLTCPCLIIQGTTDIQISAKEGVTLHRARRDSTLLQIQGMNHVLKKVPTDQAAQIASYSDPELPLHPELMGSISEFIHSCMTQSSP